MGFNASEQVEPLEYDFTYFGTANPPISVLANAKGEIPEPSDQAVTTMQRKLTAATKRFLPDNIDPNNQVAMNQAMAQIPEDAFSRAEQEILDAIAELCNGSPTREQLAALPYRHKRKFIAWLQRQLMNPES